APGGAKVGKIQWHQEGSNFVGIGSFTVADLAPGRYVIAQNVPDAGQNGSYVGKACFELASFRVLPGMPDGALPAPAGLRGSTALGLLALVAGLTGLVLPSKLRSRSTISA
ncbi:MAG TPA: hypothetical protein VFY43_05180, partial [Candidatus Limnocylindria bacterium]|nr:hypothetical protein [Candidatus Limnocylindria bacterium]